MTFKNTILSISALLLTSQVMADQVFKWVDKNGVTHYGDAVPA